MNVVSDSRTGSVLTSVKPSSTSTPVDVITPIAAWLNNLTSCVVNVMPSRTKNVRERGVRELAHERFVEDHGGFAFGERCADNRAPHRSKHLKFSTKHLQPGRAASGCVVAGVFESRTLSAPARELDALVQGALAKFVKRDMEGKSGPTVMLTMPGLVRRSG